MNRSKSFLCICVLTFATSMTAIAADKETIAIIGTGDLGDSFGVRFAELGYTVIYGSRNPDGDKAQGVVAATGNGATVTTQRDAAAQADIIFLPINWPEMEMAARALGDLSGKIVVDPSDPWIQGEDGYPESQASPSSAELIQKWNPGAKVVKALGTMSSTVIDDPNSVGGPVTIPIASNYREASERIGQLTAELGLDPVDFGPLRMGRLIDAMQLVYMIPVLQRRDEEWEFYFRRNADWVCRWQDDWSRPVYNADDLADMPETQDPLRPCPADSAQ